MIRILVDSAADYNIEDAKQRGIELISIKINIGDKEYIEGKNLERDEFYKILIESGEFPKTSQPSPQDFVDVFTDVKEKGDEMIYISLASALSGTYQSAVLAKNMIEYENIHIIDSHTATVAIKIMADYAGKLVKQGERAENIVEKIEDLKSRIKIVAGMDTLEYLYRGGRLGKTAATVGEAVNLKPVITVTEEGEIGVLKKCLGKKQATVQMKRMLQKMKIDKNFPIYSIYSYGVENCEKIEEKLSKEGYEFEERLQIGATIGTHIGPEAFGVVVVTKK